MAAYPCLAIKQKLSHVERPPGGIPAGFRAVPFKDLRGSIYQTLKLLMSQGKFLVHLLPNFLEIYFIFTSLYWTITDKNDIKIERLESQLIVVTILPGGGGEVQVIFGGFASNLRV